MIPAIAGGDLPLDTARRMQSLPAEFGGWSLYVKDGVPGYDYNFLGLKQTSITASQPLAPGDRKSTRLNSSRYSSSKPRSTTCYRWTTACSSGSMPPRSAAPT